MKSPKISEDFRGTDRFEVRRRLGAGGMGVVYEAYDRERESRVALKTILTLDATSLYRFKQEFRALADVVHPNLVRLHELFSEGEIWFFTMELVEGVEFIRYVCPDAELAPDDPQVESDWKSVLAQEQWLRNTQTQELSPSSHIDITDLESLSSGEVSAPLESLVPPTERAGGTEPLDPQRRDRPELPEVRIPQAHPVRLRAAVRQLAEALDSLHAMGKLHRDIKPSNVLVTNKGRVVLLDFGLATESERLDDSHTSEGLIVGTVGFMSPEQAAGKRLTSASDWYSVGVMLYRALTGRMPFEGQKLEVLLAKQRSEPTHPLTIAPNVPTDLAGICADLLGLEPGERPTGPEVIARLGGGGSSEESTANVGLPFGPKVPPFVGRKRQLLELEEAFAATARGESTVVFVSGRSGAGKTALTQRFLNQLTERGDAVVLAGKCYEQESVAYKALDSLIDSLSRYLRRLSRIEVEGLLPRDAAALGRIFPVLMRIEAFAEAPRRGTDVPDVQELRRRAFASLRELLARLGDRKPLVLCIDDLQWGDLDSAALLQGLLQPPDPPTLMLLCCYRGEDAGVSACLRVMLDPSDGFAGRRDVRIDALSRDEARDLSRTLLDSDDPGADSLCESVARESAGNPYFVYELIQFLKGGGEVSDSMVPTGGVVHLDEVLWRRVLRLPPEARKLMEVLAIAGRPLRQAVACRAAGVGADGFSALALLRSSHLVRGMGPGSLDDVETYHDRIRESILDHLPPDRRKECHRSLSHELEATGKADAETLAVHLEAAGETVAAGRHFASAAADAARALAFDRAAKLFQQALDYLPSDATETEQRLLKTQIGDALANAGRGFESARVYQQAAESASAEEALDLQRRAGHQYLVSGHIDEGLAAFRDVLDRVGLKRPHSPTHALRMLLVERVALRLRGLRFREQTTGAIDPTDLARIDTARSVAVGTSVVDVIQGSYFQTRSLLLALRSGEPFRIALALAWEGVHSACQGRPAQRRTASLIKTATSLAERLDDPNAIGMATLSAGAANYLEGRMVTGLTFLDRAEQILRNQCTGMIWELDTSMIFGLWARFYLGLFGDLRLRCNRFAKEARDRGDRYLESTLGAYPGVLALLAEDAPREAGEAADEAISLWTKKGFHVQHLTYYYGKVYIDLYQGDSVAAWRRVVATKSLIEGSLLPRIQHVRMDLHQISGRAAVAAAAVAETSDERESLLRSAIASARRIDAMKVPWGIGVAILIRAAAAAVRGDRIRAVGLLRSAIDRLDEESSAMFAAAARRRLAAFVGGDEARSLIAKANAWMADQDVRDFERMTECFAPGFTNVS